MFLRADLFARGTIVAIRNTEPRLGLLGLQAFPAGAESVDGDSFDHLPLPVHQAVDVFKCVADTLAKALERKLKNPRR